MSSCAKELLQALTESSAHQARIKFCRDSASLLQACGDVLWAFGLAEEPLRRALATVLQMAGRLAVGSITMLETQNWYAAGALVRQLIETEYLLFRFSADSAEAERWLSATPAEIRSFFGPGAMRKRSGSQFRVEEYAVHCERGGHPNPRASFLLPEHLLVAEMHPFGSLNWLWIDLAQHLARINLRMATLVETAFMHVRIAKQSTVKAREAHDEWESRDPWATVPISIPPSNRNTQTLKAG